MKESKENEGKAQRSAERPSGQKGGKPALDPCGKPQAIEAERLKDPDEACDEGVH